MALAQQMNTFGIKHPRLNFIGGLAAGVVLTAAATLGVVSQQSEGRVEAATFVQTSISEEWSAPRIAVATASGTTAASADDEVLSAGRVALGASPSAARAHTPR